MSLHIDPHELAAAIGEAERALAHRVRGWYVPDPESFAAEFLAAMRRQGWRYMPALRTEGAWSPGAEPPGVPPPPTYTQARAELRGWTRQRHTITDEDHA